MPEIVSDDVLKQGVSELILRENPMRSLQIKKLHGVPKEVNASLKQGRRKNFKRFSENHFQWGTNLPAEDVC